MDSRLAVKLARVQTKQRMNGFRGFGSFGDNPDFCTQAARAWLAVFPNEPNTDKYWMLCQSPPGGDPNSAFGKGARRLPINWSADPNFVADSTGATVAGGIPYGMGAMGAKSEEDLILGTTAQGITWAMAPVALAASNAAAQVARDAANAAQLAAATKAAADLQAVQAAQSKLAATNASRISSLMKGANTAPKQPVVMNSTVQARSGASANAAAAKSVIPDISPNGPTANPADPMAHNYAPPTNPNMYPPTTGSGSSSMGPLVAVGLAGVALLLKFLR